MGGPGESIISDGVPMQGGTGYDESYSPTPLPPTGPPVPVDNSMPVDSSMPVEHSMPMDGSMEPDEMSLPAPAESQPLPPQASSPAAGSDSRFAGVEYTAPRPYSPTRAPVFVRNASSPNNPTTASNPGPSASGSGGLIGPIGYDEE
jgi:hypothetical protein